MMIPHAKIALILLVATTKLHLILAGDLVPDVERVLPNDIRDSATACSTNTWIDPVMADNELKDEGKQVTRRRKVEGNAGFDGHQIVPLEPKIFIPNHLKHDEDTIKAMNLEYKTIELLLKELLFKELGYNQQTLRLYCNISPSTVRNVLEKLGRYHESYLLEAAYDNQYAHGASIKDLRDIFNIIKFPHPSQYHYLSDEEKLLEMDITSSLRAKTRIEKCVFKTLQYLYKFKMITQKEMQSFFNSPETLQRTATHLADLFSGPKWAFTAYHTLIPELTFILEDWHTEHLHQCLKDLDKPAQQLLVYQTLTITIENLKHVYPDHLRSPASSSSTEFVSHGNFMQTFQTWAPRHLADKDDLLKKNIKEMVKFFLEPLDPNLHNTPNLQDVRKIELLLNCYILYFIKEYANQDVKKLIEESTKAEDFDLKFEWTGLEVVMRQLMRWQSDYEYFLIYPEEARSIIPAQVSNKNERLLFEKWKARSGKVMRIEEQLRMFDPVLTSDGKMSRKSNALAEYFEGLGGPAKAVNWNSWLRPRHPVSMPPVNEDQFLKLMDHLVVNYNGLDFTSSSADNGWRSVEEKLHRKFLKKLDRKFLEEEDEPRRARHGKTSRRILQASLGNQLKPRHSRSTKTERIAFRDRRSRTPTTQRPD